MKFEQFEMKSPNNKLNNEKPPFLYHGSPNNLEIIKPSQKHIRDESEGLLVFGTPDKAFASMFLSPRTDESWSTKGRLNNVYYIVIDDEKRFRESDKGGVICQFSNNKFTCDKTKGMKDLEWTSKEEVKPSNITEHKSSLDTMMDNGVQVYFVDKEILIDLKNAIRNNSDHGRSILVGLQSENQKQNKNIKSFISSDNH
ncbi:MAG: hypothetical protein AAB621_00495 [Patescibacteria group bacterium]